MRFEDESNSFTQSRHDQTFAFSESRFKRNFSHWRLRWCKYTQIQLNSEKVDEILWQWTSLSGQNCDGSMMLGNSAGTKSMSKVIRCRGACCRHPSTQAAWRLATKWIKEWSRIQAGKNTKTKKCWNTGAQLIFLRSEWQVGQVVLKYLVTSVFVASAQSSDENNKTEVNFLWPRHESWKIPSGSCCFFQPSCMENNSTKWNKSLVKRKSPLPPSPVVKIVSHLDVFF